MNNMDKIVAIAAMVCSLMLVTGGTRFRAIPLGRKAQMAGIWLLIFLAIVLLVQTIGPRA
jgi:hypothetical protein